MKKIISLILVLVMCILVFVGCTPKKETIIIYSCANDTRIAQLQAALTAQFPDYDIIVEYQSTSKLAAKLLAEGKNTDADIIHDLSYLNMASLENAEILADVSWVDTSMFLDDVIISDNFVIECRTSGAIVINKDVLAARNLSMPASYEDLLKPEYKGLISMPDPKASGTGYMFVKSLVNAWGEEKAMDYFSKLSENVLQFTSSGNGPVNALAQQEVAIGLGMTVNAVTQINQGVNLEILYFEEGAPYSCYGQTIISGKDERDCVKDVFNWMVTEYLEVDAENNGLEKIFKDKDFTAENYPDYIHYSDMTNDTLTEKERLLKLWPIK